MNKASLMTSAVVLSLTGAAFADFTGFEGVASRYNDGVTEWQVIDMYANFDTDGTEAVLNIFNADISTRDGLGFNHNDLADAQGGSWKPSFSFEVPGVYDPMRDSYADVGYGVGALAALNQTALDPNFGDGLGATVPVGAGWFNLTPDNARYANGGQLHIGHFVWDASRSDGDTLGFFVFEADIGYNEGPGTEVSFGQGAYAWEIPAPGALALLGLGGIAARRRRA
jgi:hypothetical protein